MKRVLQRTCIGCLAKKPKQKLIRLVIKNRKVVVNSSGKTGGRGAYLCKQGRGIKQTCLKLAIKKNAFKKVFKEEINQTRLGQDG